MANPFDQFMQPNPLQNPLGSAMPQTMAAPPSTQDRNPLQQLLMLLPLLVAAKRGGGSGVGGFAQGYLSSRSYLDEQQRMADAMRMRQEQEQYERARQEQADKEQRQQAAASILLGAGQPLLERTLSTLDQTPGLDPEAAANQQAESYANVLRRLYPNLALTGADLRAVMPDVQTQYSARLKRHANEVLSQYEGKYTEKDLQALGAKLPFNGRAVTIDELREIAGRATGLTPAKEQEQTKPVYRQSPDKRTLELVGEIPKEAQVVQEAQPPRVSVSMGGAGANAADDIASAIADGLQPPETTGLYRYGAAVRAALARKGYNLSQAQQDWRATQRYLSTLNGPQQTRMRQAVDNAYHSLDVIEDLANQWKGGRFPALNKGRLVAAKQGALGAEAQKIATQLDSQIADVTSELANVYMGGNSPTDHALELAVRNLAADWSQGQLVALVNQARTNLKIRQNSIANVGVAGVSQGNPYTPTPTPTGELGGSGPEVWVFGPDGKLHKKGGG